MGITGPMRPLPLEVVGHYYSRNNNRLFHLLTTNVTRTTGRESPRISRRSRHGRLSERLVAVAVSPYLEHCQQSSLHSL